MIIRIGLENNFERRSLAWALDLPGCFAYGVTASEALAAMPKAVLGYKAWLESHTSQSWLADLGDFDIRLAEAFEDYTIDKDFELAESRVRGGRVFSPRLETAAANGYHPRAATPKMVAF